MNKWFVTLTRLVNGKPETISRDGIVAGTQDEAIRKAKAGIPNASLYTQVQATQVDPTGKPVGQPQAGQNPMQRPGQPGQPQMPQWDQNGRPFESFFPYRISLDSSYAPLVEATKIDKIKVVRHNGRVYIEIEDKRDLALFMKKLLEHKSPQAKMIAEGINKSME